jgi:hypothetical protein
MVKLAGAIVVCALAAFAVAFYAAGAGTTTTRHVKQEAKVVPFADPAARHVAATFAGHPAALKLPPPRVKHHAKPATPAVPVAPTTSATTSAPPASAYVPPPPVKHKSSGGTGTGTTVVGP